MRFSETSISLMIKELDRSCCRKKYSELSRESENCSRHLEFEMPSIRDIKRQQYSLSIPRFDNILSFA